MVEGLGMQRQRSSKKAKKSRHAPLATELDAGIQEQRDIESRQRRMLARRAKRGDGDVEEDSDDDSRNDMVASGGGGGERGGSFLDPKTSSKILKEAEKQRADEERKQRRSTVGADKESAVGSKRKEMEVVSEASDDDDDGKGVSLADEEGSHGSEGDEDDYEQEEEDDFGEEDDLVEFRDGRVHIRDGGLTEAEERVVSSFMDASAGERRTLADMIMAKIRDKEEIGAHGEDEEEQRPSLSPKVIQVYTEIGKMLKTYKAGKLPKAFKIIPALTNWEEVLYLTRPDQWTPHATYAATRIVASNLNAKLSQRFYNIVLLEKCRDDIQTNRNLNYHYYLALKKALYKPGAFFKGIVLPLVQSGNCTLREATIVGSVISKVSIPVSHAAVVLLKLATARDYDAPCSIFLKVLLNKKYTLPYRVIDALVEYFVQFAKAQRSSSPLPVLWHQSLLIFAQRYKDEITREGKERLKEVLKVHQHHQITSEIRRELFSSRCRGEQVVAMDHDNGRSMMT